MSKLTNSLKSGSKQLKLDKIISSASNSAASTPNRSRSPSVEPPEKTAPRKKASSRKATDDENESAGETKSALSLLKINKLAEKVEIPKTSGTSSSCDLLEELKKEDLVYMNQFLRLNSIKKEYEY